MQKNLGIKEGADIDAIRPKKFIKTQEEELPKQNSEEDLEMEEGDIESPESLDTSFLDEIMKEEDKFVEMLIKTNDQAVQFINAGSIKEALVMLERMEKILEYAASCGKVVDRNLVIVCLYNLACCHQSLWTLDKCAKYVEAVTFNINHSLKQDEQTLVQSHIEDLSQNQIQSIKSGKFRKMQFLLRINLQHCAILSQLSKHEEALEYARRARTCIMNIMEETQSFCLDLNKKVDSQGQITPRNSGNSQETQNNKSNNNNVLNQSNSNNNTSLMKDQIPYLKYLLEYAIPFLADFHKNLRGFKIEKQQEALQATRMSLFNWKTNPENNEKNFRKEFKKANIQTELIDDSRSLLGVKSTPEWLENLNIGSIMHMKPQKYKEYAHKKDIVNEISKDSLQEKVVFQSLIFFTTATEMRFQELSQPENKVEGANPKLSENYKKSEVFHLKAIELVCRYLSGPCPFINHLITSYQKHYNSDLETIPEEQSFISEKSHLEKSPPIKTRQSQPVQLPSEKSKASSDLSRSPEAQNLRQSLPQKLASTDSESHKKFIAQKFKTLQIGADTLTSPGDKKEFHTLPSSKPKSSGDKDTKKSSRTTTQNNSTNQTPASTHRTLSPSSNLHNIRPYNPPKSAENKTTHPRAGLSSTQKTFTIPNLNLKKNSGKLFKNEKISQNINVGGFKSERQLPKKLDVKKQSIQPKLDNANNQTERITNDTNLSPSHNNFFFYKNFNEFIHQLYVQDEQALRLHSKKGKTDKYQNTPYNNKKELAQISNKKLQSGAKKNGSQLLTSQSHANLNSNRVAHTINSNAQQPLSVSHTFQPNHISKPVYRKLENKNKLYLDLQDKKAAYKDIYTPKSAKMIKSFSVRTMDPLQEVTLTDPGLGGSPLHNIDKMYSRASKEPKFT